MNKPLEYYLVLASAVLYVGLQHKEKPLYMRAAIAGISGSMGYGLAAPVAAWIGGPEIIFMAIITTFIYAALEIAGGVFADKEFFLELIRARFGGRK